MPEMDGLELLAKVNEMQNPAMRVIMVSAYGDMKNIRQAMNNGAFDFATKPIDMDDLSLTIGKAIEQINYVHESQKEHTQLESLREDLISAKEIQQSFLPSMISPFSNSDKLDIFASMEAAKDIGGDFYDFFPIDDDRVALVIGDVCGKGIPAALFMSVSRTIIRSIGMQGASASECMTKTNRQLASTSVNCMFVTVFYAIFNIKTGLVTYCNAGHNQPFLLRADGSTEILPKPKSLIVGVYEEADYVEDTFQLDHGDALVMYTDGVTEAMNPQKDEFGEQRLENILGGHADKSSQGIVDVIKAGITDFVEGFEQSDDITILVLKRK